jgi:poly-gamma-glutamate capsule biosynthesis protein CapA/YwtB (metallophosphatase superfamily)
MVGDALIHASIYKDAQKTNDSYDFRYIFEYVKSNIADYDLAFYNQETIIGGKELGYSAYPRFNTPQEFGDAMVELGFNLISLANNHTLDKGETGIIHSLNYWKTKAVLTAGSYMSDEEKNGKRIETKNEISYTLLAYTTHTNGLKVPNGKDYLVNVFSYDKVKSDVEKLRDKVDVLIVSMHWGDEYTNIPNKQQRDIANFLASLNVDIIIGHHPHVIQPIEFIGNTLVFYSLGNFVSAQIGVDRLTGMMCSLKITKRVEKEEKHINFSDINATLIYTYYKDWANFKIIPFNIISNDYLIGYRQVYDKYSKIVTSMEESITVTKLRDD